MSFITLTIAISLAMYFLPAILGRHKRNAGTIFLVNLFLGWTLVGWVVALVWALASEPPAVERTVIIRHENTPDPIVTANSGLHYCTQCGNTLYQGTRFCSHCGAAAQMAPGALAG